MRERVGASGGVLMLKSGSFSLPLSQLQVAVIHDLNSQIAGALQGALPLADRSSCRCFFLLWPVLCSPSLLSVYLGCDGEQELIRNSFGGKSEVFGKESFTGAEKKKEFV